MNNGYTRQRQGRDFLLAERLRNAKINAESNYNNTDGIMGNNSPKAESGKNKSLHERLEQHKEEAVRNAAPVDGHEPVTERAR